jgi:hypothetical protein
MVRPTLLFFHRRFIRRSTEAWVLLSSPLAAASSQTLSFPGRHACAHAPPPSPPPPKSRTLVPPPQPSVPTAGSPRSPPAVAPLPRVQSRARAAAASALGFGRHAQSGQAPPSRLAVSHLGGAQGLLLPPQKHLVVFPRAVVRIRALLPSLCTVSHC